MSIYYIVASITLLLIALACYAFISQSIEKKRIQRQRLLMALKTKQRNFVYMINGFPPNFLSPELMGVLYRALIETCEQLCVLEPKDQRHVDEVTLYTDQLAALSKTNSNQRARLENPLQIKDIRQHLQELQRFVLQQEATKHINKVQAESYLDQIKRVNLQMTVDGYLFQAKQAQQAAKLRLAIHYFGLARKMLATENATRAYDKQIAQLDTIIVKLEEQAHASGEPHSVEGEHTEHAQDPQNKAWENFATPEDAWKKKQIYD